MQIWPLCIFVFIVEAADTAWLQGIERIGLVGALALACASLWKLTQKKDELVQKKDELLVENSKQMAQALITTSENTRRMAESNERLSEVIGRLEHSVGTLPCTGRDK